MGIQFNDTKETVEERTETTNYEGGQAYEPDSAEVALYKNVINNLLEDSFYESDEAQLQAVEDEFEAVAETNPEFVLKLSKYARQEENLRQIPQLLLVLAAHDKRTQEFVRAYGEDILSRTDEPLEALAMYVELFDTKTIPNCLQKTIEDAMHNWNEWQYAKWDTDSREWQYRDLLNLVHPRPRDDERDEIFEKIAKGDLSDYPDVDALRQQDTWESALSSTDDERSKADRYSEQLEEGNMGLFPRIRQARDMLESGVSAEEIYGGVTDEWIRNSRLYPFRFYQAYKAVRNSRDIPTAEKNDALDFLESAMEVSTENLPDVLEDTFVAVDTSGSMRSAVSNQSDLSCDEISTLFGALLYQRGADVAAFASDIQQFHGDRRDSLMTNVDELRNMPVGGGTSGYLIPKALHENSRDDYEQAIVFTDMQMWGGSFKDAWDTYVREVNPECSLYLVDLSNYGDLVMPETQHDVYNISGWSENVVDYIDKMETVNEMVAEIEAVEPGR